MGLIESAPGRCILHYSDICNIHILVTKNNNIVREKAVSLRGEFTSRIVI